MTHPRFDILLATLKVLQPKHVDGDTTYDTKYASILDLFLNKTIDDVSAFLNTDVDDLPVQTDTTICLMTSDFISSFGLIDTDEEKASNDTANSISSLTEGDTSVSYRDTNKASTISQALASNVITGDYRGTLMHYRKLAK
jgi:hypothetical protein